VAAGAAVVAANGSSSSSSATSVAAVTAGAGTLPLLLPLPLGFSLDPPRSVDSVVKTPLLVATGAGDANELTVMAAGTPAGPPPPPRAAAADCVFNGEG
jgi:hypothetical protein